MNQSKNLEDGLHKIKNWLLFVRDGIIIYGFRITQKDNISEQQKQIEIKEIIREADELCGNKSGNSFLNTQINFNG